MIRNTNKFSNQDLYPNIEELLSKENEVIVTVRGQSMSPLIVANRDQVILEKRNFNKLNKGEIILFKSKHGKYLLHRIHDISDLGYLTMGDGNVHFDGWVRPCNVVAVVRSIIRNGRELDCYSYFWQNSFKVWMVLLPIRGILLKIHEGAVYVKYKLLT